MKKLLFLIPLIVFSCKKEASVSESTVVKNPPSAEKTAIVKEQISKIDRDSIINNAPATKEVLRTGVMREVQGDKIIRIADAEQLPFTIGEEFDKDDQQFVLKIQNFAKDEISASIKPQNDQQNIRINQIRLPNGEMDGPFGRDLKNYEVPQKGEVWLIVGRSNMASGETKGSFSISVE